MKKLISIFLTFVMLFTLSVPVLAAEFSSSNRAHSALNSPEFLAAYEGLQVVNEIVEEVPNNNICYIYHDLSDGNSISYMIQDNKVVYKAYVITAEKSMTEYNYSENGDCAISTTVYGSSESQVFSAVAVPLTYAGQIKYRTPLDHLGTISTYYMDCSYSKTSDPFAQYNVAKTAQNKAEYVSFIAGLIGLPLGFANPLAGAIMGAFGIGASIVGFTIPDYYLHAKKTTMRWTIQDSQAVERRFSTTACQYVITDEEQLNKTYKDTYYFEYSDFINKNRTMANYFKGLIYNGLNLEPVEWTIA